MGNIKYMDEVCLKIFFFNVRYIFIKMYRCYMFVMYIIIMIKVWLEGKKKIIDIF